MLTLHERTPIHTTDGRRVGEIDRVVIDPSARRATHVIVRKGVFFPDDRVIPVELLHVSENGVFIDESVDVDNLPRYEETHYVHLDPDTAAAAGHAGTGAIARAYPMQSVAGFPTYPAYDETAVVDHNVPDASEIVDSHTHVHTADGIDVGAVREVATDDDGHLTHLTVHPGWFRSETVIPAHWIATVGEDVVRLAVGADVVKPADEQAD